MEAHHTARAQRQRHHRSAAQRRHEPLRRQLARGGVRRARFVRARGAPIEAERRRRPIHEQLGERAVHVEEEGALVVPVEEPADMRLVVDRSLRLVQVVQPQSGRDEGGRRHWQRATRGLSSRLARRRLARSRLIRRRLRRCRLAWRRLAWRRRRGGGRRGRT
eukprot:3640261-Prymnesium_polylepis.1